MIGSQLRHTWPAMRAWCREYIRAAASAKLARHRDHCLLMILGAFDSLVRPHHMGTREPAPVDHDQVADLRKSPFRIPVHVSVDLAHTRVTAVLMLEIGGAQAWRSISRDDCQWW